MCIVLLNALRVRSLRGLSVKSGRDLRLKAKKTRAFRRKLAVVFVAVLVVVSLVIVYSFSGGSKPVAAATRVLLVTSKGNVTVELYGDMPITSGNFKNLTQQGVYDGTVFHRVVAGFVVQGGDPTGTGYGDPSIPAIPDEFSSNPEHNRNVHGTVAMANSGPNTGSSQFFFNLVDNSHLDGKHPVFGRVVEGMDVVDAIGNVAVDENYRPLEDVTLISASIIW